MVLSITIHNLHYLVIRIIHVNFLVNLDFFPYTFLDIFLNASLCFFIFLNIFLVINVNKIHGLVILIVYLNFFDFRTFYMIVLILFLIVFSICFQFHLSNFWDNNFKRPGEVRTPWLRFKLWSICLKIGRFSRHYPYYRRSKPISSVLLLFYFFNLLNLKRHSQLVSPLNDSLIVYRWRIFGLPSKLSLIHWLSMINLLR